MTDATEVPMCACGDAWHEHNAATHDPTCRVLAAFATLTRERDEFEQSSLAYHKSSLEWQRQFNIVTDMLVEQAGLLTQYEKKLDHIDTLTRERDEAANLLAVIHRDGGHHTGSVGFARSCADAEAAVLQDRTERDEARVVTDAMVERVARVILSRHVIGTGKNAEKAWLWYGDDFKNEAREYLTAALTADTAQGDV
jgi:hypothetical protein